MMSRIIIPVIIGLLVASQLFAGAEKVSDMSTNDPLEKCNVVWTSPSQDQKGSMPIGNGDIGANAWVESGGDLVLLLSKTDSWAESGELLKLGRLRIKISPNPMTNGAPFRQALRLRQGEMLVEMGEGEKRVALRVWIDAGQPVIRIEANSHSPFDLQATLEMWRPDTVVKDRKNQITWYHRNEKSIYPGNLKHQSLDGFLDKAPDPLLHRTFGGTIQGDGLINQGELVLKSQEPRKAYVLSIFPHCSQTDTTEKWLQQLDDSVAKIGSKNLELAYANHCAWWREFWDRSWIYVTGNADAETLTRAYALQRWVNACGGRGGQAIKFNGSTFTVDWDGKQGPDYRRWGQCYWWQNTRLVYWPMLACGDYDLMQPLFRMYSGMLPLAKFRTKTWFQHEGAFIAETAHFWGMYNDHDYGLKDVEYNFKRNANMPIGEPTNPYVRRYYTSSPELMAMMLDYYSFTGDDTFLRKDLLPMCDSLLTFWDQHYQTDEKGKMKMYPAQSLETWHDARNPAADIAGLQWILGKLLQLPEDKVGAQRRAVWTKLKGKVPPLPMANTDQGRFLLAAEEILAKAANAENPELYAVFPFRLYGVGKPDLKLAQDTYNRRRIRKNTCWYQDAAQAAFLGLTHEAASMVAARAKAPTPRFPAFWGPNHDWTPDLDHGGVMMIALQAMILQADDGKIHLLPAWPKHWNVDFKLHTGRETVVMGNVKDGKLQTWEVTPASRKQDVIIEFGSNR